VLGGGFSGVETAGELEDFLRSAQRFYKNVQLENCRIIIIHSTDRLLPELSPKLSAVTLKNFKKRNIDVRLNERAAKIENEKVTLKSGEVIEGATIVCTIGTIPHAFVENQELPTERGKVVTQADMSVNGPVGVWAMGDCAVLAKNIVAALNDKPSKAFSYKPQGMLASIGHNKAVAEIYGMHFSGIIGFMLWRGVYLLKVPTLARKVRLFLEWNWAMFFPPDIAHLGFKRSGEE